MYLNKWEIPSSVVDIPSSVAKVLAGVDI
jgi:hypothetical protein